MSRPRAWATALGVLAAGCLSGFLLLRCANTALAAVPCTPDVVNWTPTPTVQADHDQLNVAFYRLYAKPDDAPSWWWHLDLPYVPANPDPDTGWDSFAPCIDVGCPVQRVVPDDQQDTLVDVMLKAVNADGVESEPSNVVQICMPEIWHSGEPYR